MKRQQTKYYNDLAFLPLWNLIQVQISINEGKADYKYMIVDSHEKLPKKIDQKECKKAFTNIKYQMPLLDNNLYKKWALYLSELRRVQIKSEINKNLKLVGKRLKKIDMLNVNQAFSSYRLELEAKYKEFEFTIYSLEPKFKELWKEHYPRIELPRILTENNDMHFFLFEEYLDLLEDYKEASDLLGRAILTTEDFVKRFIKSKKIKFNKLTPIEKRLSKFFISIGQPKKWHLIRTDFFSIKRLKCIPKSDNTMIDEVIVLRKSMTQSIDLHKTTFAEYQRIKVQAKREYESMKRKNKPNAG
jgi:hypothetical protein